MLTPPVQRILERIEVVDCGYLTPCWLWPGRKDSDGYGRITVNRVERGTYRVLYEGTVGPVAKGFELNHRCRVLACCNPDHLEPVTHRVNMLLGASPPALNLLKTHCIREHEYTPANTRIDHQGHRQCRTCEKQRGVAKRERARVRKIR